MNRWLRELATGPVLPGVVLSAIFAGIGVGLARSGEDSFPPVFYQTRGVLALEEGANLAAHRVGEHASASAHHLLIAARVRAHRHARHDETVVVLAGRARFRMGDRSEAIGPGSVLLIPRGTVHALEVTEGPLEAVSVFSPPFDGKDRIFEE
jgi:mannose-6-phosphate isomerase-like protein (cupin superfamily)